MTDIASASTNITRRGLMAGAGAGGLLLAQGGRAYAQTPPDRTLKIGFISPRTGPLAGFGESDPYVLEISRKALAQGLTINGKTYGVTLLDRDTQSDPARAGQLANQLISQEGIDLMLTTSTPEVVNPVSDACEAAGMPCVGTVMPWEAWYFGRGAKPGAPSPFKWTYLFSFGVGDFAKSYISEWNGPVKTNRKVGILFPNDADGNAVRHLLPPMFEKGGFTVVDAGIYEDGTTDFSAQIAKLKSEDVQILSAFPIPPDFITFWRQAAQQGYTRRVKIASIAKMGLFPSDIAALGPLGPKLAVGCYWHANFPYGSPVTKLGSRQLADDYENATGRQWNQQLGASMSLVDTGIAALMASNDPKNRAAVAKAFSTLNTMTTVGKVDFTSGPVPNVSPTPIIGCQWVKSKPGSRFPLTYNIVENAGDPKVPITAPLVPYA